MSIFNQISAKKPRYNRFNLDHSRKFSADVGRLIPIMVTECVPGDSFILGSSQMVRFAPLVSPVMHEFMAYTHFFFVPNRILWPSWEDFITGGRLGDDASVFPTLNIASNSAGSLDDFLGLPNFSSAQVVSAMPYAAYQLIWMEYFRDQNQNPEVDIFLIDGDNTAKSSDLRAMRTRAWQHDYFTSALPWTQRGPEATIPLGSTADVVYNNDNNPTVFRLPSTGNLNPNAGAATFIAGAAAGSELNIAAASPGLQVDNSGHLQVDLTGATASTINDLRRAYRLQEWLEKNARGGARYTESILSHFGVRSSDARLQRPEFIGGTQTPIRISEVLQTSATASEPTPQGNMSGHAIGVGGNGGFKFYCEEHGYIIGIMSVLPKSAYQQGIPKHFKKFDKFDYYWPSFAHLGEQPIYNYEIYADSSDGLDDDVFGYTPRYAEYKYIPSTVHGNFRNTLDFWHAGRIFSSRPALNNNFIICKPDEVDRIFAVTTGTMEQMYIQVFNQVKARRPMPYFGTPTI